jgi:hypothetical protein
MSAPERVVQGGRWYAETAEQTMRRLERIESGPPPPPEIGRGLIYRAQTHTVYGPSDAGKSLLAAAITTDVLNAGGRVLWLDFEQGADRVLRRLLEFGADKEALIERLHRVHHAHGAPPLDAIDALGEDADLAVVDAFTGLLVALRLSSNSDTDVETAYIAVVRPLAVLGAGVLVIDHVRKDRDQRGGLAIGSGRKVGAADVALNFEAVKRFRPGYGGRAKITVSRDRDGAVLPVDFVLEPDMTWRLEPRQASLDEEGGFRPTGYMQLVSIYLEAQTVGVSGRNVNENVDGRSEWIRRALAVLVAEGYVTIEQASRSVLHSSARPFREADDPGAPSASGVRPGASGTHPPASASMRPPRRGRDALDALAQGALDDGASGTHTPEPSPDVLAADDEDLPW